MLIDYAGAQPTIHPSAYVAPNATISGDVTIGPRARILFGAVITADGGPVSIGESAIVMEQALIRGRAGRSTGIGAHSLVGPHAHVNGARVGDEVFLATGVSVFPNAVIGDRAEVRINAVVQVNTVLAPGALVPIGWIALGDPARLFSPEQHDELWAVQRELDFPGTVFGLDRDSTGMVEVTEGYAELFGHHRNDRIVD